MTVSVHYCTTVDISPELDCEIQTKKPFPLGNKVEITISLEGQNSAAFNLSGVTRWIAFRKTSRGTCSASNSSITTA